MSRTSKKKDAKRRARERSDRREHPTLLAKSAFQDFLDMNDASGMAEGAAWALAEEMAGLEPGEGIDHINFDEEDES